MRRFSSHPRNATVCAALGLLLAACPRRDVILGARGSAAEVAGRTSIEVGGTGGDETRIHPQPAAAEQPEASSGSARTQPPNCQSCSAGSGAGGSEVSAGTPGQAGGGAGRSAAGAPAPTLPASASAGCGREPASDSSIRVNTMIATYRVDLPNDYDKQRAYPLVLAFHRAASTADDLRAALNLADVTGGEAIVVYPNSLNDAPSWEPMRDIPLYDALLAKLEQGFCVDSDRIFAAGDGNGSLFVNLLGCVRSDQLRGIGLNAGAPPPPGPCAGDTAVLIVLGSADPMMVGPTFAARDFWAAHNMCDVRMPRPVNPSPCVEYAGCSAGMPVRYCEYEGDSAPSSAATALWSFFSGL